MGAMENIALVLGLLIVWVTHLFILNMGGMPKEQSVPHAWSNLVAAVLLTFVLMPKIRKLISRK